MTYVVKINGKIVARIVCSAAEDFEAIRAQYFPQYPANLWRKE